MAETSKLPPLPIFHEQKNVNGHFPPETAHIVYNTPGTYGDKARELHYDQEHYLSMFHC